MHIMTSNEKKQKGAIIIEASIVLPVFMFFMMTILSIAHIAYLQAKVAVSLDRTAKQIASYSHIWYATGYGDIFSGDSGKSSKVFDELAGYLEEIGDFIGSDTLISASKSLYETNLTNIFKDELAESMATAMLYRNILGTKEPIDSELEKFERKFHIDHNSWTMAGSKYLNNNTEVFLKISYKVHVIRLLSIEKHKLHILVTFLFYSLDYNGEYFTKDFK